MENKFLEAMKFRHATKEFNATKKLVMKILILF